MASVIAFGQQISTVSISPNPVSSGNAATATVTISKAAGSGGFKIELASSEATAATVPASVTIAAGSKSATFAVTALPVTSATKSTVKGTDPAGKTAAAVLTVDPAALRLSGLSISPTAIATAKTATGTVTLTEAAPSGGFEVKLSSAQAFVTLPTSVSVASGKKSATFTITADAVSSNETATIQAMDLVGYDETATLTVEPAAVRLTKIAITPSSVVAANPATGTVTLSAAAPTGGVVVALKTAQSYIGVPKNVKISAGATSATFTVTTNPVLTAGTAMVTATDSNGYTGTASLSVTIPQVHLSSLAVSPSSVVAGSAATGKVTLSANAASGGFVVNLSTMQTFVSLPLKVTIPSGSNSATFTISTTSVASASNAMVTGSDINGYGASATLTVNPPAATMVSMTSARVYAPQSVTVPAGSVVTFTNTATGMSHTVTADTSIAGLSSGNVSPGQSFSWTVPATATSGTKFYFHCEYHGKAGNGTSLGSGMAGVIIVK